MKVSPSKRTVWLAGSAALATLLTACPKPPPTPDPSVSLSFEFPEVQHSTNLRLGAIYFQQDGMRIKVRRLHTAPDFLPTPASKTRA